MTFNNNLLFRFESMVESEGSGEIKTAPEWVDYFKDSSSCMIAAPILYRALTRDFSKVTDAKSKRLMHKQLENMVRDMTETGIVTGTWLECRNQEKTRIISQVNGAFDKFVSPSLNPQNYHSDSLANLNAEELRSLQLIFETVDNRGHMLNGLLNVALLASPKKLSKKDMLEEVKKIYVEFPIVFEREKSTFYPIVFTYGKNGLVISAKTPAESCMGRTYGMTIHQRRH